jgi:small subunit ribosomal protein S14
VAKKSKIVKNDRRRAAVARYAERRAELERVIRAPASTFERRLEAQRALARQPRDAVDGRPRGHLRKFGLSRVPMREMAHDGQLPGIGKASW